MREPIIEYGFSDYKSFCFARLSLEKRLNRLFPQHALLLSIVINEAVNNAFFHGCGSMVSVSIGLIGNQRLIIRVKHSGVGFAGNEWLDHVVEASRESLEEQLTEHGRGLLIMSSVMDYLRYNAMGTELLLMKALPVDK